MTKGERLNAIMKILEQERQVQNRDLIERFQVTDMTVRRDLDCLVQQGRIIRIHGGAIPVSAEEETCSHITVDSNVRQNRDLQKGSQPGLLSPQTAFNFSGFHGPKDLEPAYMHRVKEQSAQKHEIAQICMGLLQQETYVFLDSGSTTFYIAQSVSQECHCTFITNGINIAYALLSRGYPHVIYVGGEVYLNTWATRGAFAEAQIRNFHADIAFIGCNSISPDGSVMIGNTTELGLKKAIIEISNKIYLAADSSKFDSYSLTAYANVREFDGIITDSSLPVSVRENIQACGGKLLLPPTMENAM